MHGPRLGRVNVGREVVHEVILGQPGEALVVDVQVRQCRGRGTLGRQPADGFSLIQAEARHVDQAGYVRRIHTQCGDDLAPVGVAGGWGFRAKVLDQDLEVSSNPDNLVHVLQDSLHNTYQGPDAGRAFSYLCRENERW